MKNFFNVLTFFYFLLLNLITSFSLSISCLLALFENHELFFCLNRCYTQLYECIYTYPNNYPKFIRTVSSVWIMLLDIWCRITIWRGFPWGRVFLSPPAFLICLQFLRRDFLGFLKHISVSVVCPAQITIQQLILN